MNCEYLLDEIKWLFESKNQNFRLVELNSLNQMAPDSPSRYLSLLAFCLARMDNIGQDDCTSKDVALKEQWFANISC
jgi:hypothetical protein